MRVDPIADRFAFVSTYNYAENSPIGNIDLHGLQGVPFMLLFKTWCQCNKAKYGKKINQGLNNMSQGASNSNPTFNNAPISQRGKDALHKLQTNAGAVETVSPVLEIVGESARWTPMGAAAFGLADARSSSNQGDTGSMAMSLFLIPFDVATGGKASKAKAGGKTLYRAIGPGELKSIIETRKLGFKYGGLETKFFAENLEDAIEQGVRGVETRIIF